MILDERMNLLCRKTVAPNVGGPPAKKKPPTSTLLNKPMHQLSGAQALELTHRYRGTNILAGWRESNRLYHTTNHPSRISQEIFIPNHERRYNSLIHPARHMITPTTKGLIKLLGITSEISPVISHYANDLINTKSRMM